MLSACTQKVSALPAKYWWIIVWLGPRVRAVALVTSLPTPKTQELFCVVTKLAVGAPVVALPVPVAPMAPDPFVPDGIYPCEADHSDTGCDAPGQSRCD